MSKGCPPRFILFLACAFLGGCFGSTSGDGMSLEQQVQQHDAQLRQLQPSQADTWNQLQAMRQELNAMKGQMDDLQRAGGARALERTSNHDAALRQIEDNMALNLNLGDPAAAAPTPAPMPAPAPTQGSPAPDTPPYNTYGQPVPGNYGQPASAVPPTGSPRAGEQDASQTVQPPSGSTWGKPSPQPATPAPVPQKDISLALFDAGVNSYNARNYAEAQRSFSDFLKNYKTHDLAGDAHYYLAECYFQRNQFADAALAYNEVITRYPASKRAPGAYLKQGISFSKSGQKAAAKARLQELIKKFPNSPEAARAKSFLKTNS